MAELTICPKFFFTRNLNSPLEVEKELINPFIDLVEHLKEKGLRIQLSQEIYNTFFHRFPWAKKVDPEWQQYISDWEKAIGRFFSLVDPIEHPISNQTHECTLIQKDISDIFLSFLNQFKTILLCSQYYENSIFIDNCCERKVSCQQFQLLQNYSELDFVNYTWLSIYDPKLPIQGKVQFQPVKNWERLPGPKINSANHSFIDHKGMEWKWDLKHKDHWDVQLNNGTGKHLNIFPNGRIRGNKE